MRTSLLFIFALIMTPFVMYAQSWTLKNSSYPSNSTYTFVSVIHNKAYIGNETAMFQYDPVTNNYVTKTPPATCTFCNNGNTFTINDTMYVIDKNPPFNIYQYNETSDSWTPKNAHPDFLMTLAPDEAPGSVGVLTFSIGNKGYIGGFTIQNMTTMTETFAPFFYEYNPVTDSYTQKAMFPFGYDIVNGRSFSINNQGYLLGSIHLNGSFGASAYSYNQTTDTWSNIATQMHGNTYSGGQLGGIFVLNGKAYYGMSTREYYMGDTLIESYNPATDTWSAELPVPTTDTLGSAIGFTINGKGYMGLGYSFHSSTDSLGCFPHYKLYEFSAEESTTGLLSQEISTTTIYPNPTSISAMILLDHPATPNTRVELTNALGELIWTQQLNTSATELRIDVHDFSNGMYLVRLIENNTVYSIGKLLVSK